MNIFICFFLSCVLVWILALYMWGVRFYQMKNNLLLYLSLFLLWLPPLFFILCAYIDKKAEEKQRLFSFHASFRLRLGICVGCWFAQILLNRLFIYARFDWHEEIATALTNIVQFLLILLFWNLHKSKDGLIA